jgi:hypothetical protein
MSEVKPGRQKRAVKSAKRRDGNDASLYPLDPETAIRAIMDAGPHPKDAAATKRSAPRKKPR